MYSVVMELLKEKQIDIEWKWLDDLITSIYDILHDISNNMILGIPIISQTKS